MLFTKIVYVDDLFPATVKLNIFRSMLSTSIPTKSFSESLSFEADILHPLFGQWHDFLEKGFIYEWEFASCYFLAYSSIRTKGRWCGGIFPVPIDRIRTLDARSQSRPFGNPAQITLLPGLENLLHLTSSRTIQKFAKRMARDENEFITSLTLFDILSNFRLCGLKSNPNDMLNRSLCSWANGTRLFKLLFHIPSPMQVLRLQATGQRVLTLHLDKLALCSMHTAPLTVL